MIIGQVISPGQTTTATFSSPLDLSVDAGLEFWVDASDLSTMFTDKSGTTPVTGNDQDIQLWTDKSGNGNDVTLLSGWIADDAPHYKTDGTLHWADYASRFASAGSRLSSNALATRLFSASSGWLAIVYEAIDPEKLGAVIGEQLGFTDFRRTNMWADTRATPNRFATTNNGGGDAYVNYPSEQPADKRVAILYNNNGTLFGYHNGSPLASTVAVQPLSGTTRIDLGWQQGSHGSFNHVGKIFEAVAGSGTLSAQDIVNLTAYLKNAAGL